MIGEGDAWEIKGAIRDALDESALVDQLKIANLIELAKGACGPDVSIRARELLTEPIFDPFPSIESSRKLRPEIERRLAL